MEHAPADSGGDCAACERDDQVDYYAFMGKDEKAVEHAAPLLSGKLRFAEVPHVTYGAILRPLLRLKNYDLAVDCHRKGYPMVAGDREFITTQAEHLEFLVLTDNLDKARLAFEKHLPFAVETLALSRRFEFYLAALMLARRLVSAGDAPLRTPAGVPETPAELAAWLEAEAHDLARKFDDRNGTPYFTDRLDSLDESNALRAAVPLK